MISPSPSSPIKKLKTKEPKAEICHLSAHPSQLSDVNFQHFSAAFTLVELLTVIAIIGILSAIIIPVTGRVRDAARATQCATHLRSIYQASILYANDNKEGRLPPTQSAYWGLNDTSWWWEIIPYVSETTVFACPLDKSGYGSHPPRDTWTHSKLGRSFPDGKVSYGVIGNQSGATKDSKAANRPLSSFAAPATSVYYTETQHQDLRLSEYWCAAFPKWYPAGNQMAYPHRDKANLVFIDGHIARMSETDIKKARDEKRITLNPGADPWEP